jgi:uncharacterized protein (TIGR03085 family)
MTRRGRRPTRLPWIGVESVAAAERAALCALFDDLGPDAPTLCEGWTTCHLAAHLYVRERRPDAVAGILVKSLAGYTEQTMRAVTTRLGYAAVVQKVRNGPPLPVRLIDSQINTLEFFVHHEDVRRAADEWAPRDDARLDGVIWAVLRRSAGLLARRVRGAGLDLVRPDGGTIHARTGVPLATITGGPQEIALYLHGRSEVAQVSIEADDAARAALGRANFAA